MTAIREALEDQLEKYEQQLASLNSYIKELKDMTERHGTEKEHFDDDLMEAEHNVKYYQDEIARIRKELKGAPSGKGKKDSILPRTKKQGIGSAIISSISFVAGAILGSKLMSKKGDKEMPEKTKEGQ
jgi:septal ring factor EnvC (AmiA/AmiB activator)